MNKHILMIKKCLSTNKKYLCKTSSKNPKPYEYNGSGIAWLKHIKKHDSYIVTCILGEYDTPEELKTAGMYYSKILNIIESDEWLNERGNGGHVASQRGKHWKVKDTSAMGKGTKNLIDRSKTTGINNYQCNYSIQTPWGIFETLQDATKSNSSLISDSGTLKKYINNLDIPLSTSGRRTKKEWRGKTPRELGFNKIKYENDAYITEIFYSLQGEGYRVGVPSIFIRLYGCCFTCPKFGQDGQIKTEDMPHNTIDLSQIKSLADLPVFDIGCDSPASWSKRYLHLSKKYTINELFRKVNSLVPNIEYGNTIQLPDLVITGGEPLLLHHQKYLLDFFKKCTSKGFLNITFETNGSQILSDKFINGILEINNKLGKYDNLHLTFSVSPKLSNSGEPIDKTLKPKAILSYYNLLNKLNYGQLILKFVVRDKTQIPEVEMFVNEYKKEIFEVTNEDAMFPIYLMPEGATTAGLSLTEREVAEICLESGYRYSPRLQVPLWKNKWGT